VSVNKKVLSSEELRHSTNAGERGIFFKIPNGKESFCQCGRHKRHRFDPCVAVIFPLILALPKSEEDGPS